jgi:hypothetical protein
MRAPFLPLIVVLAAFLAGCSSAAPQGAAKDPSGAHDDAAMAPPPAQLLERQVQSESYATSAGEGSGGSIFGSILGGGDKVESRALPAEPPPPPPAPPPTSTGPAPQSKPTVNGAPVAALLIYTADLYLAVHEPAKTIDRVERTALDMGGYLVRRDGQSITVRVPAASYRAALEAISAFGDVVRRDESVEDVTDQFYDLTARLRNARALRARLEDLLQQAKDVNEALAVQRELGKVNAEIESMETRLKVLRELIAFSTITVHPVAPASDRVSSTVRLPFGWLSELGLPNLLSL